MKHVMASRLPTVALLALALGGVAGCTVSLEIRDVSVSEAVRGPDPADMLPTSFGANIRDEAYAGARRIRFTSSVDVAEQVEVMDLPNTRLKIFPCGRKDTHSEALAIFDEGRVDGGQFSYSAYAASDPSRYEVEGEPGADDRPWPRELIASERLCVQVASANMAGQQLKSNIVDIGTARAFFGPGG